MDILEEAAATVNQKRMDEYGKPEDSFGIIAEYWETYLCQIPLDEDGFQRALTKEDVAIMMTLFKIARMSGQKYSRDNPRDAIGYLKIYADRLHKEDKTLVNVRTLEGEEA